MLLLRPIIFFIFQFQLYFSVSSNHVLTKSEQSVSTYKNPVYESIPQSFHHLRAFI